MAILKDGSFFCEELSSGKHYNEDGFNLNLENVVFLKETFVTIKATYYRRTEPVRNWFKKFWKNDEAKFRLYTSLKLTSIPFLSLFFTAGFFWILVNMNFVFFRANEYRGIERFEEIFFDFPCKLIIRHSALWCPFLLSLLMSRLFISLIFSKTLSS